MEQSTTINGSKATQNKEDKQGKQQKSRKYLPSLPTASAMDGMAIANYKGNVDKTPVEFASLNNYEIFSMSPDGSAPMMRITRSKAVRLFDCRVFPTSGGRVYRISQFIHYMAGE
ncbi:hypothetical protein NIES4101_46100 [Calothrix sp. NIES-4101]|nr:hypothetical protein NIES4101_46100 [Calothrix sp. NIES-4101]